MLQYCCTRKAVSSLECFHIVLAVWLVIPTKCAYWIALWVEIKARNMSLNPYMSSFILFSPYMRLLFWEANKDTCIHKCRFWGCNVPSRHSFYGNHSSMHAPRNLLVCTWSRLTPPDLHTWFHLHHACSTFISKENCAWKAFVLTCSNAKNKQKKKKTGWGWMLHRWMI